MNIWISDAQRYPPLPPPTHHIEISGCEVRSGMGTGVLVSPNTDSVHLIGNSVHDNGDGSRQHQGLYFQGQNGLIMNNLVYHHTNGFGIQVRGNYPDPDTLVEIPARNVIVTANTVVGNSYSGIMVENNATLTTVVNNISAFNGTHGVVGYDNGSGQILPGNVAYNNDGYANPDGGFGNTGGAVIDFSRGNLLGDPRFVDRLLNDYRLLSGSAAVDVGLLPVSPSYDYAGQSRPRGPMPDLGAHER
jgi:Right handed beta helix region